MIQKTARPFAGSRGIRPPRTKPPPRILPVPAAPDRDESPEQTATPRILHENAPPLIASHHAQELLHTDISLYG